MFLDNFTHYMYLAIAISLFVVFFRNSTKIILSKVKIPGLQQAIAGA